MGEFSGPERGSSVKKTKMEADETKETKTLQDICREAKNEQHLTYANIAEKSEIVEKTVQNFFSSSSKLPPVYTAGPICRALGVSLDKYFDISTDDQPNALEIERQKKEHLAEMGEMKDAQIERSDRSMRQKDRIMIAMAGFILFLIAYMTIVDLLDPMIGLFHGEFSAAGAVALLGFTIAAVSFVVIGFANIKNRKK